MPLGPIEGALGGIGLFLLGMRLMSDGIRTVADARIRHVFTGITSNRFSSVLFGAIAALALNSGSAAVIFTIGLINGGVLNAFQAFCVLGGALVGSSLPLHLHIIPYSLISTPLIFFGVLLKFFARRRRLANTGDLILGIGLLFLGLTLLEGSFRPFDRHPVYALFSGLFFHESLPATLFGAMVAFLVQSARSSVGVVASLATAYGIDTVTAGRMVLGGVTGIAAMGSLASVGGNAVTRRVAAIYLVLSLAATLLLLPFVPQILQMLRQAPLTGWSSACVADQPLLCGLACIHLSASLLTAVIIIAFSAPLSRFVSLITSSVNGKGVAAPQPCAGYLDRRILTTPPLAIEQVRKEIVRMMSVANFMYADVHAILFDFDARRSETIRQHEQVLDSLNHEITAFLAALSRKTVSPEITCEIPGLFQTVTDLEHIGDRCENILECIIDRKTAGIVFSDDAMHDLKRFAQAVGDALHAAEQMVMNSQESGFDLHEAKGGMRSVAESVKQRHFDRISAGVCPPRAAKLFIEMTSDMEAIAGLCWNIIASQGRKRL